MTDSADNVLSFAAPGSPVTVSPAPQAGDENQNILERFQRFKAENPQAIEYVLQSEAEAEVVLTAIIPTLRSLASEVKIPEDRMAIVRCANEYQAALVNHRALAFFRKMTDANQLEVAGIKITAAKRWAR